MEYKTQQLNQCGYSQERASSVTVFFEELKVGFYNTIHSIFQSTPSNGKNLKNQQTKILVVNIWLTTQLLVLLATDQDITGFIDRVIGFLHADARSGAGVWRLCDQSGTDCRG